jgi:peptide/nickel transport system substrate-binding protein
MRDDSTDRESGRRRFLRIAGGSATAATTLLAGCSGQQTTTETSGTSETTEQTDTTAAPSAGTETAEPEASSVSRGDHLRIAISADPQGRFQPHKILGVQGVNMARNYANSLVRPDSNGQLQPDIASDWEVVDDTTYVFTLRENVTFHPPFDRNLTADDVVANVRRILDESYGSNSRSAFTGLLVGDGIDPQETVRATGEYEVTFDLAEPFADFPNELAGVFIIPMEAVDEYGEDFGTVDTGTFATGPYRFVEGTSQDHYTFEANPEYFKEGADGEPLPYVDRLTFRVVPEASVRLTQLETGEVDLAEGIPSRDVSSLQGTEEIEVASTPSVTRICHFINQANVEAFSDKTVRQALMHAVDREAINDVKFNGRAEPGWGVFPPWHWAHSEEAVKTYPHDPEQARSMLAEAGRSDLSFECDVTNQPLFTDVATIVQQNYEAVGVEMELVPKEKSAIWGPVLGKWGNDPPGPTPDEYESHIESLSVNMFADSFAFWKYHSGYFLNVTYYDESDDVIEEARRTTDRERRKELYAQLQRDVTEYCDRIGLVWTNVNHGLRSNVSGYSVYPNGRLVTETVYLA